MCNLGATDREKLDGIVNPARKPHQTRPLPLPRPDGRQRSRTFSRKIDVERWLKVSEAETLTGQRVDPPAGEKLVVPYAEERIGHPSNESLSSRAAMEPRVGDVSQAPNASAGMERRENGILTTCLWRMWW